MSIPPYDQELTQKGTSKQTDQVPSLPLAHPKSKFLIGFLIAFSGPLFFIFFPISILYAIRSKNTTILVGIISGYVALLILSFAAMMLIGLTWPSS